MPGLKAYALKLYRRDGVSAACLLLQDRMGLDVNVLLFAAFMGSVRRRALAVADVAAAQAEVAQWHAEVVRPMRAVRRRLKAGPPPAPSAATAELRAKLQAVEIEAELIELDVLDRFGATLATGGDDPLEAAAAGMAAVAEAAASRALRAEEHAAVRLIAVAAGAAAAGPPPAAV